MADGKIDIHIEIPVQAAADKKVFELVSQIESLVRDLPAGKNAPKGWPKLLLSVQRKNEILKLLHDNVLFDAAKLFSEILDPKKPSRIKKNLKPIFEGELARKSMSVLMRDQLNDSGLSERAFCAEFGISYRDFRRVLDMSATLDKSVELLSEVGVLTSFSAYEAD